MKKVNFIVVMLLSLVNNFTTIGQFEHYIGDPVSDLSNEFPIKSCLRYTYSQQIYFEEELSAAGIVSGDEITGIQLFYAMNGSSNSQDTWNKLNIYLGNVQMDGFPTGTPTMYSNFDFTLCYTGVLPAVVDSAWFQIDFNNGNFVYNGGDIILAIDENSNITTNGCGAFFKSFETASNGNLLSIGTATNGGFSGYVNPNPNNTLYYDYSSETTRNQIKLITPCVSGIENPLVENTIACVNSIGELHISNPQDNVEYNWYSQPTGGTVINTGTTHSVMVGMSDTVVYVEGGFPACALMTERVSASVLTTPVNADLTITSPTCDGGSNGGFSYSSVNCGTEPLTFSVNGGVFNPPASNLAPGLYTLVIKDANGIEGLPFDITIEAPVGLEPSDVTVSLITEEGGTVVWTPNGTESQWNVEWGAVGFNPGMGEEIGAMTSNSPSAQIGGLQAQTSYDVYVQSECGTGATWVKASFETYCPPNQALFCEGFDPNSQTVDCWTIVEMEGTTDTWELQYELGVDAINGYGAYFTNGYFTSDSWLISPWITLTGNEALQFEIRPDPSGQFSTDYTKMEVRISTTGKDLGDFTTIVLDSSQTNYVNVNDEFIPVTVDLSAYTGNVFIAFRPFDQVNNFGNVQYMELILKNICVNVCQPDESTDGTIEICQEAQTIDLNNVIVPGESFGTWYDMSDTTEMENAVIDASTMTLGEHEYRYVVEGACDSDTASAILNVIDLNAGEPTQDLMVCKNQPLDLFTGIQGDYTEDGTWYDENDVAIQGSMIVSAAIGGSKEYKYIIEGTEYCDGDEVTITVIVNGACDYLGIDEKSYSNMFQLFPNPTSNFVTIKSSNSINSDVSYTILDINGREVVSNTVNAVQAVDGFVIDLSDVQQGVYLIHLNGEAVQETMMIVKQQ